MSAQALGGGQQELSPRSREILRTIIGHYIRTGEPVGSRTISKMTWEGLSPATIRNVMADLEEMGYLTHPHPSAGRVPTDKAYRFYVDHLERVPWDGSPTSPTERAPLPPADAAERLMAEMPSRLSQRTHMTGMLLAPPLQHTALARVEVVSLGDDRALAV